MSVGRVIGLEQSTWTIMDAVKEVKQNYADVTAELIAVRSLVEKIETKVNEIHKATVEITP